MKNPTTQIQDSRLWLLTSGMLFLVLGFAAMASPIIFTALIVKALAFFILISGVISFVTALFSRHKGSRLLEVVSGIIRIAAGIVLLSCLESGARVLTLAFAIYLLVEGLLVMGSSLKLRTTPGWQWTLVNGIAALVLGILVYLGWPSSSFSMLGLFFGINLVFKGAAQIALGTASRPVSAP